MSTPHLQHSAPSNQIGLLRYLLAFSIVIHHTNSLTGSQWPVGIHPQTVVALFFLMSGYFAWSSWQRRPHYRTFVLHRLRRLLPAYWAVVLGCAIALVSVSTLSPLAYFASPQWWAYVGANLSLLNFLAPTLPGVFDDHLVQAVNPALWYVKVEVLFTLLLPLMARGAQFLTHRCPRYRVGVLGTLFVTLWSGVFVLQYLHDMDKGLVPAALLRYATYLQLFVWGMMLHSLLPRIRLNGAVGLSLLLLLGLSAFNLSFAYAVGLPVALALVLRLFLADGPLRICNRHNLSYSIYLCHCPLLQLACEGEVTGVALWIVALALLLCAYLLHRYVEGRWA